MMSQVGLRVIIHFDGSNIFKSILIDINELILVDKEATIIVTSPLA